MKEHPTSFSSRRVDKKVRALPKEGGGKETRTISFLVCSGREPPEQRGEEEVIFVDRQDQLEKAYTSISPREGNQREGEMWVFSFFTSRRDCVSSSPFRNIEHRARERTHPFPKRRRSGVFLPLPSPLPREEEEQALLFPGNPKEKLNFFFFPARFAGSHGQPLSLRRAKKMGKRGKEVSLLRSFIKPEKPFS